MKKRLFAMLLALALVVSLLPVSALAAAKDWNFVIQPVVYDNGSKVDDYTFTSKNYSGTTTGKGDSGDAVWDWSPSGNNYALHSSNDYPHNAPVRYVSPEELWEYDSDELEFKGIGKSAQATFPSFGATNVYNNEQDTLTTDVTGSPNVAYRLIYLFEVKEEPKPVVPEGPDLATIKRSNVQITIKCDNPEDHEYGYTLTKTLVEGSYTLGEVVPASDGAYTCDVTIDGEHWVNYYKTYQDKDGFTHSVIEGQDMNPVVKLEWTEEAGWHKSANYEIPVINVHHEAEEEPEPEERVSTYKVEVVNGHITYKTGLTGEEAFNAEEVSVESGTTLELSADLYVYFTFYSDGGLHEETLVNGKPENPQTNTQTRKLNYQPAVWNEEIKVTFAEPEPETYTVSYEWGGVWKPYDLLNKLPADAEYEPGDEVRVTTDYFLGQTYDNGSSQFYKFLGWTYSPEVELDRGEFTMPEEDVVITGTWLRDQNPASVYHTVNIEVINCTATCGTETITSTASIKVADGAMPIIVFKGDEGYALGGITVGGSRVTSLELDDGSRVYYFKGAVTGDKNVVITYEDPNMPEIPDNKFDSQLHLIVKCINPNATHNNGTNFVRNTLYKDNYELSEVKGNIEDGYYCEATIDGDKWVDSFITRFGEHSLVEGENTSPVVTMKWMGEEEGWQQVGDDPVIKVVCEDPGFSITYETGCEDEVTGMPENTTAAAGAELTLTATPARDGYIFDGWTSEQVELDENGGFTMPEKDVTFTAQWVKKSTYDPDKILANQKYIKVEVYVDGQLVSGDNPVLNYIDLASPNETAEFDDEKDWYRYDFEYYNCLSIGVTAKPGYVVEAIDSYLMYGQDGTDGIFDTADSDEAEYGEYFIDNARSRQTVSVYLRTPYSVKFFGTDGEVIAQYTASGLVAGATDTVPSGNPEDAASSVGETGHYHVPCDCASTAVCPHIGWVDRYFGQRTEHIVFVAEKADSVEMPVLPEGADGWYLNDEAFTGDTYEVDAADATDGVISFYAKADEAEAATLTVKHEYTLITREYQDGVYVETGSESVTETAGTIEGLTAGEYTIPEEYKTALEGYEDYKYSDDNPVSVTLEAGENEVTLKFVDYAYPVTYKVEYRLFTYVGDKLVKTEYPEPFTGAGMSGEQITIEVPEFEGFEFNADKSSSLTPTLVISGNNYHLNYYKYITEPSHDDLWDLFRGNIKVQCVNEDADHHSETGIFNLYENGATTYYSVEASETVEGAFDVTIYGEGYLEDYQNLTLVTYFDVPEHSFVDGVDSITVTVVYDEEEQAWTCDALPVTFEVVCESATEPVDPGEPGYEELWELFRDGIKVECVNGEAEHYGETGTYGLFNNTATETYFSVEKGETAGSYEVTIYGEEYLEDYETETLTGYDDVPEHSFVDDADSITVTVVYDPANAKWTCEALPITFKVVCENPPVHGYGITGFAKSLVTERSVYRANRIAYPEFGRGGVIVDEGDSVTLIYRITVKGVAGTEYTVSDPGAKLLSGSWTGTLDEDGSDTLLVAKTFSWYYARHNDFLVNSASVSVDGHTAASATRRVYFDIDWDYNPPKDDDDEKEDDGTVYVPNYLNTSDHDAYIVGYEDGTIRPNSNITRAEVATIFYRLLTKSAHERWDTTSNSFTDVAEDSWYNDAVSTLSRMGIVNGYADGSFKPDAQISRAEFTAIATRFFSHTADYKGAFNDVAASSWYADYVQAAVDMSLVDGYPDGGFHPDSSITRAEAVTIVNRVLGRAPHEDHLLSTGVMNTWSDNLPGAWYYADMQEATNSHNYSWVQIRGERVEDWTAKTADPNW